MSESLTRCDVGTWCLCVTTSLCRRRRAAHPGPVSWPPSVQPGMQGRASASHATHYAVLPRVCLLWRQVNHREEWLQCLRATFDAMDADRDGRLRPGEILEALRDKLPEAEVRPQLLSGCT